MNKIAFLFCLVSFFGCEHEVNDSHCKTIIQCEESHSDRTCSEMEDGCHDCEQAYMEFCVEREVCGEELDTLEREGKIRELKEIVKNKKIY